MGSDALFFSVEATALMCTESHILCYILTALQIKSNLNERERQPLATPGSDSPLKSPMGSQDKYGSGATNDFKICQLSSNVWLVGAL